MSEIINMAIELTDVKSSKSLTSIDLVNKMSKFSNLQLATLCIAIAGIARIRGQYCDFISLQKKECISFKVR